MTGRQLFKLIKNMGLRYAGFRFWFELKKRSGLFYLIFPSKTNIREFVKLDEWRKNSNFWGVIQKEDVIPIPSVIPDFQKYEEGYLPFFSSEIKFLGKDYNWLTNPDTGYRYSSSVPWWKINDYSEAAGDIKYVWEKSRFAFLYDIIRHDKHTSTDHSQWVIDQISSWIKANPVNTGPNYKCSQEISLRVLNWTYALNYYRNSPAITASFFKDVMHSIYWQLRHIYSNINFSRIAVRNNHAITETLTLYLAGITYPFFTEAEQWKVNGKKWFEKEIEYQIYEDGTFLQYSMNYHRVVIQLLTWAFKSADSVGEQFKPLIYERAYKSLKFLFACQDQVTGWLPNYGSNDGALFFKFSSIDYRDYRPQLNTLHLMLTGTPLYDRGDWQEDACWFKSNQVKTCRFNALHRTNGWESFADGGYYILREDDGLTFIRCGNHKNRPAQADNLHLDIWHKGENILFDGGSYKYNTDKTQLKYFMGTRSHNTVMLDDHDQMLKGDRFIWYNWSQTMEAKVSENDLEFIFEGEISAFTYLGENIRHRRILRKRKNESVWQVEDKIINKPLDLRIQQLWHILPGVSLSAMDSSNKELLAIQEPGWRSDYYGIKKAIDQQVFVTEDNTIISSIELK